MRLMGARLFTLNLHRDRNDLTLILSLGRILRRAKMKREVRYGKYYVDFANDLNWIIEVDGTYYHQDVVADQEREIRIREMVRVRSRNRLDTRILRIPAYRLRNAPAAVHADVMKFLSA
jgi:very-short-patch-repair endonuclease